MCSKWPLSSTLTQQCLQLRNEITIRKTMYIWTLGNNTWCSGIVWSSLSQIKGDSLGKEGVVVYQAVPGTAHRVWPIAHLSIYFTNSIIYYTPTG